MKQIILLLLAITTTQVYAQSDSNINESCSVTEYRYSDALNKISICIPKHYSLTHTFSSSPYSNSSHGNKPTSSLDNYEIKEQGSPFKKNRYNLVEELNPVSKYQKLGYVDKNGLTLILFKYTDALSFN